MSIRISDLSRDIQVSFWRTPEIAAFAQNQTMVLEGIVCKEDAVLVLWRFGQRQGWWFTSKKTPPVSTRHDDSEQLSEFLAVEMKMKISHNSRGTAKLINISNAA